MSMEATAHPQRKPRPLLRATWRAIKVMVLLMATYLLHVCVMPHVKILGITPSLVFAVTAVLTVGLGKLRAAWIGMFFGILLEVMQPTHTLFNLLIYPISAIFGSLLFADKGIQQLEYERGLGKPGRNVSSYVRTPLCALADTAVYEIVNLAYVYLRSANLTGLMVLRGLADLLLTALIAAVIMLPIRRYLGIRPAADLPGSDAPIPYKARKS